MSTTKTITKSKRAEVNSPGTLILSAGSSESYTRISPSCQQLVEESFTETTATLRIRSCLADSALYPVITGHLCNKTPLVPSSLYADMALTAGTYIWTKLRPNLEAAGINVCDMEVPKPIIAEVPQKDQGQWVEMHIDATLDDASNGVGGLARCSFRRVQPDGTKIQDTASCVVRFEDRSTWVDDWSRIDFMVKNSMASLQRKFTEGEEVHCMQRGLAYKTFSSFVTYSPKYRGMEQVIFNGLEGTSNVKLQTHTGDYCAPFHLDNSCHLSGFLANACDLETDDYVYISEGWVGLKILDIDAFLHTAGADRKTLLNNYTRMQPKTGNIVQGDVYVFEDDVMVAVWEGVKFKRLPKRVVNIVLPPPKVT